MRNNMNASRMNRVHTGRRNTTVSKSIRRIRRKLGHQLKQRWFRSLIAQWCIAGAALLIISVVVLNGLFPQKVEAMEDAGTVYYKYYQTIRIEKGDRLWDYAQAYKSPEISTEDYIREVIFINQMSGGSLVAGTTITVPYYSTEYTNSDR